MNMKFRLLILLVLFTIPGTAYIGTPHKVSLIEKGASLEKLAGDFAFTEGPASDRNGNVYFTDQPNNRIMIWTTSGELKTFMQPCGRSNGLYFDRSGNLLACADEKNELWKIGPNKSVSVIIDQFRAKRLNGPNDLWISPSGGIYITDPFYKRSWWDHSDMPQEKQRVYLLDTGNKSMQIVADDLVQPNGIIGTPDGKTLYIADIGGKKTYSYSIGQDGTLNNKKLFCEMGSDGMTIDEKGNIYLTGNGVTVFSKKGVKLINIPVPEKWTANVSFGGPDMHSLFITASTGLYRMRMQVGGTRL
jgi:gluconolactonase